MLGTRGATLLGNKLRGKVVNVKISGQKIIRAGEGRIRAGQDF